MKIITFLNVRIAIEASSAAEAYSKLCDGIALIGRPDPNGDGVRVDWETDTYTVDSNDERVREDWLDARSTLELFPNV